MYCTELYCTVLDWTVLYWTVLYWVELTHINKSGCVLQLSPSVWSRSSLVSRSFRKLCYFLGYEGMFQVRKRHELHSLILDQPNGTFYDGNSSNCPYDWRFFFFCL